MITASFGRHPPRSGPEPLKNGAPSADPGWVRFGRQTIARPYLVGLGAAVLAGSMTAGLLVASAAVADRQQVRQQEAAATIDNLPLPPTMQAMSASGDCRQVNVDRCLTSTETPPETLTQLTEVIAKQGPVTSAGCGDKTAATTRPDTKRCSFETEFNGVPIQVMLWPHITEGTELTFEGTDIWIDIVTDSDV